ncbi:MAG: serine hydrolase [Candidatus Sericytochromatia bacterium]|nr:serine hydrolase [Candidatus Tanganyikabacteria bacterium]
MPAPGTVAPPSVALAARRPDAGLQAALDAVLEACDLPGAGVFVLDLEGGRVAFNRPDDAFYPASIIKVPVMVEVVRQIAFEGLDPEIDLEVTAAHWTETWKPEFAVGDRAPLRRMLDLMITRSDNAATNVLIDVAGRHAIDAFMAALGVPEIRVRRKLGGNAPMPDADWTGGRNAMTPRATATLFEWLAGGVLVNAAGSARMLEILGRQEDRDCLPRGLPPGARIYHKTGRTSEVTHDAGLVERPPARYVLVVFTERSPSDRTCDAIGRVAAAVDAAIG